MGHNLTITGTINRADGTNIVVWAYGPKDLPRRNTTVTNKSFSATFFANEIGQDAGTYTIRADDWKGNTETTQCQILPGAPPSPPPTPTPVAGSGSSSISAPATASPSPSTPSPTPAPSPTMAPIPMPSPSLTPAQSQSTAPAPTITSTPAPTPPPTPKPSPGFDLLLALPALGAAAYLYRRR